MKDKTYTLYGAPLSLYSGKARAYLRFKQIPFEEVFSSLKVYKKIVVPNTGVRFIPVLKTPDDHYIQDTSVIIDQMEDDFPERSVVPSGVKQNLVSHLFEIWGDEWLLIPAMHYRWNHDNFPFIHEEFGKIIMPNMPAFIRRYVGKKAGAKFKGFVPLLGITNKSIPAIEDWYENHVLTCLDKHFAEHNYLLGTRPCRGDFGLMGPLYAHLYRDPAPGTLMKRIAPNVVRWIERMNTQKQPLGEWLEDDQIADSLLPLLRRLFEEFWPVLRSTNECLNNWIMDNPNKDKLPRMLGEHKFSIGKATERRAVSSFHQWKLQRIIDHYFALNKEDIRQADNFLTSLGVPQEMNIRIDHRVVRRNNHLFLDQLTSSL